MTPSGTNAGGNPVTAAKAPTSPPEMTVPLGPALVTAVPANAVKSLAERRMDWE